jgi:hypothetical protein
LLIGATARDLGPSWENAWVGATDVFSMPEEVTDHDFKIAQSMLIDMFHKIDIRATDVAAGGAGRSPMSLRE